VVGFGAIGEPSRRDNIRSFRSRGPTELKDPTPTVRNLNIRVTKMWPLADLRKRECTLWLSRSVDRSEIQK